MLRGPIVSPVDDWSSGCDGGGARRLIVMTYALLQSVSISGFLSLPLRLVDTLIPYTLACFVLLSLFCFKSLLWSRIPLCSGFASD